CQEYIRQNEDARDFLPSQSVFSPRRDKLKRDLSMPKDLGLPRVLADLPVAATIETMLKGSVELLPWSIAQEQPKIPIDAIYTYGHPLVDGNLLDRLSGVRVISNFGVGVDHIDLHAARARGIPVGNTPGILNGATADMGFALLLAAGRRLI